ncbi:hypothetical protein Trydic_g12746 [Trypoxylus dichotomus]
MYQIARCCCLCDATTGLDCLLRARRCAFVGRRSCENLSNAIVSQKSALSRASRWRDRCGVVSTVIVVSTVPVAPVADILRTVAGNASTSKIRRLDCGRGRDLCMLVEVKSFFVVIAMAQFHKEYFGIHAYNLC